MAKTIEHWNIGRRIAPPRFVMFVILFLIGLAALIPSLGWGRGTLAAFDIAAFAFLVAISTIFRQGEADQMREASKANDANRGVLLGVTGVTTLAILVAVASELKGKTDTVASVLVVVTLAFAWLFSNMVYALHYAHMFYEAEDDGADSGGIDFPKCDEPDYWDFLYFSYTLGMTFQTSDVQMTSRRVRIVAIFQCLAAFVFNLGVIAFTINVLGGGGG